MSEIFSEISDWLNYRPSLKEKTLGFVPTMGALHQGHLSLVRRSQEENDVTLVSIFVNPTQFNQLEDFQKYPRFYDDDVRFLQDHGVDYVLMPDYGQLYPDHFRYQVHETQASESLCGKSRPGHFTGVLTVVMKLLNIAQAHSAYFGEKDYQQLQLVQGLVDAFFMTTNIVACPTVREPDGLALSSRNQRLSPQGRIMAAQFYQLLQSHLPLDDLKKQLQNCGFEVDYVEDYKGRRYGAVYLEGVRLIDNISL